jgi:hypothetical protein
VHFLIAAAILAVAAAGWHVAVRQLKLAIYKEPVPWRSGVEVHAKEFRLLDFPEELKDPNGNRRFVVVKEDRNKDGQPEADIVIRSDELELLKIGTPTDKKRWANRCSNWYFLREYEAVSPNRAPAKWLLECYYYTGMLDQVPHVPERCGVAAGGSLAGTDDVTFDFPEGRGAWGGKVVLRRAVFSVPGRAGRQVQYYVFSLNGRPEPSWKVVRLSLIKPWVRYCYFAKVQFAPRHEITDLADADRAANEFFRCFMPKMLELLPTPEDVEKLSKAGEN